jgi:hypothetical protein
VIREAGEAVEEAEGLTFATARSTMFSGLAVSIDEIAIEFPMATEGLPIAWTLVAIALQAFVFGYIGGSFDSYFGARFSRRAGLLTGVAFMLLGVWLIVSHALPHVHRTAFSQRCGPVTSIKGVHRIQKVAFQVAWLSVHEVAQQV